MTVRGASLVADGVRFEVWAPKAERLSVCLRAGSGFEEHPLERGAEGVFEGVVRGAAAGSDYYFRIDGNRDRPDPVSRWQPEGVHGPSRVVDPAAFRWTDGGWRGLEMADCVLYELHVGTFTAEGTFDAVVPRLPELRELGVTAIEIMPVAEFPGARNWGYDGVHLYAPSSAYGGPEGLRRLVDAAHAAGLGVVLDVVYNHVGPEGNYLSEYGPYFTDRYHTPWGSAVNFDGPDSDEVRRWVIDNACHWAREYHVDGLRLDAVHSIFDFGARHLLAELTEAVHAVGREQDRRVVVIAESDLNDPRVVSPPERGGHGLDAQWSDDFHHAVHAALTHERSGYYEDFGGIAPIAHVLEHRFWNDGRRSAHRRRRHGAPALDVPADRFVVFVQNHDQVGNRATGERLSLLLPFEAQKLAAALLLLSPYVPLLFMGEEYGETNPFLYFVSHSDPALVEAVRDGRRREFESFAWRGEVPDPQAESTFERSKLEWRRREEPGHAEILELHRDLLALRRSRAVLRPGAARVGVRTVAAPAEPAIADVAPAVVELSLEAGGESLVAYLNPNPVAARVLVSRPLAASGTVVLDTEDPRYGGSEATVARVERAGEDVQLTLARFAAVAFERRARA